MSEFKVYLKVTKAVKDRGQKQITVKGLPERTDKKSLSFKNGVTSLVKFTYSVAGEKCHGDMVIGDTHGIHRGHQNEEQAKHFDALYTLLTEPQEVVKDGKKETVNPLDQDWNLNVTEISDNKVSALPEGLLG